jgi:hypothetical protein
MIEMAPYNLARPEIYTMKTNKDKSTGYSFNKDINLIT